MTSIDLQLPDEQAARLDRFASSVRKSRGEATAQLVEEALRHEEFPAVEFRDSIVGRQAYVVGSSLAVWEVLMVAETYALDPAKTAAHLGWPRQRAEGVLGYIHAHSPEILPALAQNDAVSEEKLRQRLPHAVWTP